MEITSTNLEPGQGITEAESLRNTDRVKFDLSIYNPYEIKPKNPSVLSRIFSFMGGFAPLGIAAAPFTGGTSLIGAAALGGMGQIGNQSQARQIQENVAAQQGPARQVVGYPGLSAGGIAPISNDFSGDPANAGLIDLISTSRDNALYSSPQKIGK